MTPDNLSKNTHVAPSNEVRDHGAVARGFGQTFGILPSIAFLTFVVDAMLFGAEAASLGTSIPVSCTVGAVLGFITFRAQRTWYGDDDESAWIKALIVALLVAIPTPLPAMLYVPAGFVGLVHNWRRK